MSGIGPTYDLNIIDEVYEKVMHMLRDNYHIQNDEPDNHYIELRAERNANLKNAIKLLVELDSWENF